MAPSGKRILLLDCGDWLPRQPDNRDAAEVFGNKRDVSPDTWLDGEGKAIRRRSTASLAGPPSCTSGPSNARARPLTHARLTPVRLSEE